MLQRGITMATKDQLAQQYADRIRAAASSDRTASSTKSLQEARAVASSRMAQELAEIGQELERLSYSESGESISEEDQQEISDLVGRHLGIETPRRLRMMFKEASINQQLKIVTDIRNMINSVKPKS